MSAHAPQHDAQKALADLRDHLARHDKPIAFFFGAGTSCAVPVPDGGGQSKPLIPAVAGLTTLCKQNAAEMGEKYATAWAAIETQCAVNGQPPNVENILSRLRMMLSAIGQNDTLAGLKTDDLKTLEECVRKSIAGIVTPDLAQLPPDFLHRLFARWLSKTARKHPVEIFTINYDVLIEHALEAERVPFFDGFVGAYQPFFHPDSLRRPEAAPGAVWSRLWKMHGSVTWRRTEHGGRPRVIRGAPDPAGEMILPSFQKYDESRQQPYSAFSDRLTRFLEQDDALLIVAGFGFGDEHINSLMFGALENRPRTHVYALQFEELPETDGLIKRAYQRSNLIVIGPESGILGSRRGRWSASESPAFAEGIIDVTKSGDTTTCRMNIGDFARFCRFLQTMTAS
jgi:hypothetical protein